MYAQGHRERDLQNPRGTARTVYVNVHLLSLRGADGGFKRA